MNPDQVGNLMGFLQFGLIVKLFVTVLGLFYVVFAVVVYRQISLMTQVLDTKISPLVKMLALVQIGVAGVLTFLALVLG